MDMHEPVATLVQFERALGGYVIRWRCASYFLWQCVSQQVKSHPRSWWRYEPSLHVFWIAESLMPQLAPLFVNYDDALASASHRPHSRITRPPAHVLKAFASLHLQTDAPPHVIRAAYRALNRCEPVAPQTKLLRERAYRLALSWAEEQVAVAA